MKANEELNRKIARAFASLSQCIVKSYKEDLMYDIASCINELAIGNDFTTFLRDSGSYSLGTYKLCAKNESNNNPTWNDCVDYAKSSLEVEYIATFERIGNDDILVTIRGNEDKLDYQLSARFKSTYINYQYIQGLYK